jgi:hypothetical protein
MTRDTLIDAMALSISIMEGFPQPGSSARRNNNPGNLRSWGRVPVESGFAKFPSPEAGWRALKLQVAKNIGRGLTMLEFFAGKPGVYPGYAPAADSNQPYSYARFVARRCGVPEDVPLQGLIHDPAQPPQR